MVSSLDGSCYCVTAQCHLNICPQSVTNLIRQSWREFNFGHGLWLTLRRMNLSIIQNRSDVIHSIKIKIQVKVKSSTCYSASYTRRTRGQKRFGNLGSSSWLAWANDTAAHYAAIHCPRWRTIWALEVLTTMRYISSHLTFDIGPAVCS